MGVCARACLPLMFWLAIGNAWMMPDGSQVSWVGMVHVGQCNVILSRMLLRGLGEKRMGLAMRSGMGERVAAPGVAVGGADGHVALEAKEGGGTRGAAPGV